MQFLYPYALFGLLAISIPIIIHLFNFRRYKKLYFTNLSFLKSVRNETRKQQKLRHFLILMSRILAIIFLVLAFARPYIPGPGGEQSVAVRGIDIYIDNSLSMQSALNGTSLLEIAKARAREVIEAYGPSDRFRILTNDFEGRHQRYFNKDEVLGMIPEIRPGPAFKSFAEVYERIQSAERLGDGQHVYFISDFQRSSFGSGITEPDTNDMLFFLPVLASAFGNVYIDSVWFATPYSHIGQKQMLSARIVNASETDLELIPVRLEVDGKQAGLGSADLTSGSNAIISLAINHQEAGWHNGTISIEDHPITWDDEFLLSWSVTPNIPVLLISEEDPAFYFTGILEADSAFSFEYTDVNSLDYSLFSQNDLIILHHIKNISSGLSGELAGFVEGGGSLLIIPAEEAETSGYNALLSKLEIGRLGAYDTTNLKVTGLDAGHAFFTDVFEEIPEKVDLPAVNGHFPIALRGTAYQEVIMDLQNGDPYLMLHTHVKGKTYLLSSPLGDSYGNLARHALWVPVLYRMAMMSGRQEVPYYVIGEDDVIETDLDVISGEKPGQFNLKDSDKSFVPAYQRRGAYIDLLIYDMIDEAGHYEYGTEGEIILGTAFNYDRLESDPSIFSREDLLKNIEDQGIENIIVVDSASEQLSAGIAEISLGKHLWKSCIWIALLFILIEILLLRLFRK